MSVSGYKQWADGDILTPDELDGYLVGQTTMRFATSAARTAALPAPVAGMRSWLATDGNEYIYRSGAWVRAIPPVRYIVKSATETVTGSTTMQNDDDFVNVALAANKVYRIQLLITALASTTGDIATQFVLGGGAAQKAAKHSIGPELASASGAATLANLAVVNATSPISFGLTTSGVNIQQEFLVETTTSGTAGTVTFQWAQNSNAGNTQLTNSSYMIITEVEV